LAVVEEAAEEKPDDGSSDSVPAVKAPPERLSGSKAAEIRKRMLAKKKAAEEGEAEKAAPPETGVPIISAEDIVVRRARPSDVPSILLLIQRATEGAVKIKRGELLMALGDRGYLIGQQGSDISAVVGWHSENLVARIDQIYVYPPESAHVAGPAVLQEIEDTAASLMCEVILAFPANGIPAPVMRLFLDKQFEEVELARLPDVWQAAVAESQPENTFILMKKLRDTRVLKPV
jgi:N-acetylglutamate synthase-like GNAT family acetyltransferase